MGIMRTWKERTIGSKVDKATRLFLKGNHEKAKRLLQNVEYRRSGDVIALNCLMTETQSDSLEHARETYRDLWKAKLGILVNDDLAQAVDAALDAVTPLVMERAKEDIRKMHQYLTDGDKTALFDACKEHVAYGHPDAVALQVAGFLRFGANETCEAHYYHQEMLHSNWFYDLSRAKRKGFSKEIEPLAEQALHQLKRLGADGIISDPVPNWPLDEPLSPFDWQ
ncbi:MAG: hypothetical protein IJN61_00090 [Clostridia bacterium]|nr:hypothetical protein [Clostridia bacterium]